MGQLHTLCAWEAQKHFQGKLRKLTIQKAGIRAADRQKQEKEEDGGAGSADRVRMMTRVPQAGAPKRERVQAKGGASWASWASWASVGLVGLVGGV